jgi:vacuolar protein sorting-associated protein 26
MRDINKKFSVRYYLNLVLVDEEERRYFKQQVSLSQSFLSKDSIAAFTLV